MDLMPPSRYVPELRAHRSEHRFGFATIPVFVVGPPDLSPDIQFAQVRRGLAFVGREFPTLLAFLCKELFDIKSSGWLKEGEQPLTAEEFSRNLTPRRVTLYEDGSMEVGFADLGMFWGHEVVLRTDQDLKPVEADIEG